jgi:segregation and condensation protein A
VDVDNAGEFLVLAATLLEVKARRLGADDAAPESADDAGEPDDLAADLVRQLLRYKAYRDAADALEARHAEWATRYPAGRAAADRESLVEAVRPDEEAFLDELELVDLVEAYRHIAETVQLDRLGDHAVTDDDTPIELHAADILDALGRLPHAAPAGDGVVIHELFSGRPRGEIVGLFIALLELVRQNRIRVQQDDLERQIVVNLRDPDEPAPGAGPEAQVEPKPAADPTAWEDDHIFGDEDEEDPTDDE